MKMKYIVLSILAAATAQAGSLDPSAGPAPTMATLDEIYQKLQGMPQVATNNAGAASADVLAGKAFWGLTSAEWGPRTGTMPTQTLSDSSEDVPAGYYEATTLSAVDADLDPENIRQDVNVFGMVGSMASGGSPVGTIQAWHKDLPGVPSLPDDWMECNGQTVSDPASPLDGATLPNLNAASGYDGGRFLRGGSSSGVMQEATHIEKHARFDNWKIEINMEDTDRAVSITDENRPAMPGNDTSPGNSTDYYVRPVNMSVVWIIKIK